MALGLDVYRYQSVVDWKAVVRHGVKWIYVKGTDGAGRAQVWADQQANGAKGAGLPVGLYHFVQATPGPEVQADVLLMEVRRLNAMDLPPALDMEDPPPGSGRAAIPAGAKREFARRFLQHIAERGFRPCLYANTSDLNTMGADSLRINGARPVIWCADYGVNDGVRHKPRYRGHIDIHQYTSVGQVPGIHGRVDVNESFTEFYGTTAMEGEMSWDEPILTPSGKTYPARELEAWTNHYANMIPVLAAKIDALTGSLSEQEARTIAALREITAADSDTTVTLGPEHVDAVIAGVVAGLPASITQDQVEASMRRVFADAGQA